MTDERMIDLEIGLGLIYLDDYAQAIRELCSEVRRLREELGEQLYETLMEHSSPCPDGWYQGNGRSEARYAGEELVGMGLAEAHPENVPGSRVNKYRLKLKS